MTIKKVKYWKRRERRAKIKVTSAECPSSASRSKMDSGTGKRDWEAICETGDTMRYYSPFVSLSCGPKIVK